MTMIMLDKCLCVDYVHIVDGYNDVRQQVQEEQ
jgi:hypothetical protein